MKISKEIFERTEVKKLDLKKDIELLYSENFASIISMIDHFSEKPILSTREYDEWVVKRSKILDLIMESKSNIDKFFKTSEHSYLFKANLACHNLHNHINKERFYNTIQFKMYEKIRNNIYLLVVEIYEKHPELP